MRSKDYASALRNVGATLVRAVECFVDAEGVRLAAAFAFYALIAFFPLLLLAVSVLGYWLGDGATVREELLDSVGTALAPEGRKLVGSILAGLQERRVRGPAAVLGFLSLAWAASGVFTELETGLNRIFRVPPRPTDTTVRALLDVAKERVSGFGMMCITGLLFFGSLVVGIAADVLEARIRGATSVALFAALDKLVTWCVLTLSIAALYRVVVHTRVAFRYLVVGASVAAIGFTGLKSVFALYLARFTSFPLYGIIGAVLALGVWLYLSAMALFAGAQIAQTLAIGKRTESSETKTTDDSTTRSSEDSTTRSSSDDSTTRSSRDRRA